MFIGNAAGSAKSFNSNDNPVFPSNYWTSQTAYTNVTLGSTNSSIPISQNGIYTVTFNVMTSAPLEMWLTSANVAGRLAIATLTTIINGGSRFQVIYTGPLLAGDSVTPALYMLGSGTVTLLLLSVAQHSQF